MENELPEMLDQVEQTKRGKHDEGDYAVDSEKEKALRQRMYDHRHLCCVLRDYLALVLEEKKSHTALAIAHGWMGDEEAYKRGVALREEITELQQKVGLVVLTVE